MSHYQLSTKIHGPGHILQGLFVSAAGLIALQIAVAYLSHRYPKPVWVFEKEARTRSLPRASYLLAAVLAAAAMLSIAANAQPQLVLAAPTSEASYHLSAPQWRLIDRSHSLPIVVGGPRPNLGQQFQTANRWEIEFFSGDLAYSESTGGVGYRSVHVATPAALSELPVKMGTGTVFVNNVSFRNGGRETDVVYWYDIGGSVTSQVTTAKLKAIWSLFAGGPPLPQLVVVTRSRVADAIPAQPLADFVAEVFHLLRTQDTTAAAVSR